MKRLIQCLSCNNIIGYYKSYKARLQERTKVFLTGEVKEQDLEGRICKDCNVKARYSAGRKKDKKVEEPVVN